MAINALYQANYIVGIPLLVSSLVFLVAFVLQRKTNSSKFAPIVTTFSLYSLMIYLVYSGGVGNTGPIWIFMVSPVSLFIRGLKQGLIEISVFLMIISIIMFLPDTPLSNESYDSAFKLRIMLSFLTVTFLSACYEYSREKSLQHMQELSKEYQQLALHDSLTQLPNRRNALQKLEFERPGTIRNNGSLAVILCDVDHFKSINDHFGHDGGDLVLVELAGLFSNLIRAQDMVARWGGEEFLFILPLTDIAGAIPVAEKIHSHLKDTTFTVNDQKLNITVSMGIAETSADFSINETIKKADKFLYQAKESGRNRTRWKSSPS